MNDFEQFKQTFFDECEELLQQFEDVAGTLKAGSNDPAGLDDMFRSVHSIKAGAGAFKFDRLVKFAHELENVMDRVRSGRMELSEGDPEFIIEAGDVLQDLVAAARRGVEAAAGLEDEALGRLQAMLAGGSVDAVAADVENVCDKGGAGDFRIDFRPHRAMYETANEPQLLFHALVALGELSVVADLTKLPDLAKMQPDEGYVSWQIEVRGVPDRAAVEEVFEFVDGDCDLTIEPLSSVAASPAEVVVEPEVEAPDAKPVAKAENSGPAGVQSTSIRVELERVDQLVDMVGELVIAQAMALDSLSELVDIRHVKQLQALEDLTMRTRQLQEGVMAVRMQPLKALFQRFPRIVRDLSRKLGKSVRLELDGEATEVDKTIIEELSDPLTHMIRNCMDHGLETPEERQAAGKPEQGVVRLSAEHRNGRILIRVSDDGRGLNPEKVFNKAVENGLVDADAELNKEEIEALIFMPGFSTAAEISDVSGRGVGMDVVRRNIQKLGGRVTVESNEGEGSTFTLALPLTLAVLDGMLVSVAGERYVVPLSAIVETVCPDASVIRALPDGGTVMPLRGEAIRLIDLCQSMNLSRHGQAEPLRKLAVIVETEFGRRVGLVVDELLGQQQVVIKSLEANYRRIEGVAGTAILGDGRVRLILDIDGLAAMAGRNPDISPKGGEIAKPEEATGGLSA
ncbi:chemotaxis protein CheA [Maricaulis sp.]|uniref:chemotaxis protein CheA n=1 Tax=Maricaulis sp. TaxID=1486257 RepID=UPI00262F7D91|nr:chemotaxis protein CheA [Maricaulis sp.]